MIDTDILSMFFYRSKNYVYRSLHFVCRTKEAYEAAEKAGKIKKYKIQIE
ncbi:MAG: hypothetical protein GY749_13685 [Desulfobacteraceae bacterium]|nr:hypothetical protein [Desulfobacteraceae bacterium]